MLDQILLGFLTFRDHSLYELQKAMQQSTSMFYSASAGSVLPALNRLLADDCVEVYGVSQGKRNKKYYRRTARGQVRFEHWLAEPLKDAKIKDEVVLRLFFLGYQHQDPRAAIADYMQQIRLQRDGLQLLWQHKPEVDSADQRHALFFQWQTLKFALDYLQFCDQWLQQLLSTYEAEFGSSFGTSSPKLTV